MGTPHGEAESGILRRAKVGWSDCVRTVEKITIGTQGLARLYVTSAAAAALPGTATKRERTAVGLAF